jgi:hypothetical protein
MLLCISILAAQAQAIPPPVKPPSDDPKMGLCEAALVLSCLAIGVTFVVWAMNKSDGRDCCIGPCTLILERDNYSGMWTPVATNYIDKVCHTNKFEVFRVEMENRAGYRFRVKVVPGGTPPQPAPLG